MTGNPALQPSFKKWDITAFWPSSQTAPVRAPTPTVVSPKLASARPNTRVQTHRPLRRQQKSYFWCKGALCGGMGTARYPQWVPTLRQLGLYNWPIPVQAPSPAAGCKLAAVTLFRWWSAWEVSGVHGEEVHLCRALIHWINVWRSPRHHPFSGKVLNIYVITCG